MYNTLAFPATALFLWGRLSIFGEIYLFYSFTDSVVDDILNCPNLEKGCFCVRIFY